jgi:hypothetical protein
LCRCPCVNRGAYSISGELASVPIPAVSGLIDCPFVLIAVCGWSYEENAMISRQRFETVREKYGHCASWALWAPEGKKAKDGMGDISFFDSPSDEFLTVLDPETVLVGLNISRGAIERPFGNFHPDYHEAQDYKLRYALHETNFWGGYLTDAKGKLLIIIHHMEVDRGE